MKKPVLFTIGVALLTTACAASIPFWSNKTPKTSESAIVESTAKNHVSLIPEKAAAAEIQVETPLRRELQPTRIVPGRIEYDATRHVEVKSPFDGLIRQIDVKVGDQVQDQQIIAVVDSPQLGEGRSDVLLRESDFQQAVSSHEWWHTIQTNLEELIERLQRPVDVQQLEKEFAEKLLGDYRQQILGAYSKMRLAEKLSLNLKPATDSGAVSIRLTLEVGSARDTATAAFKAACEQATFEAKQQHLKAESVMNDAERRLKVARQRLSLLVNQPTESIQVENVSDTLSTWPVKAPFTGTVEEILLAPKERVLTAQGLFQIADTTHLWVQADIREKDWKSLTVEAGQKIDVQTPALPGETLPATIAFVGRKVVAETRAVPITAEIDNSSGNLRPGMFVRVLLPDGEKKECLTLPQTAVASNDGRTFVFIETGTGEYDVRDVVTGLSVDPWIEIVSGVEPQDRVVCSGTNALKAELLLESED